MIHSKSFKNIEQSPQINNIFYDLLNISTKYFDSHLNKIEASNTKTFCEVQHLKYRLDDLQSELLNLDIFREEFNVMPKNKLENTSTLQNEIKNYMKRKEKSLDRANKLLPYELISSPEKQKNFLIKIIN